MRRDFHFILCLATFFLVFSFDSHPLFGQDKDAPKVSSEPGKTVQDRFEDEGEGKESEFIARRMQWFHDQRAYPRKTIPPGIRQAAAKARDRKVALEAAVRKSMGSPNGSPPSQPAWTLIGPQPVGFYGVDSGRVSAIAINPSNPQIIYMGGAEGGVWKTVNGGTTWVPLTDAQVSLATGSIAIDPSNPNNIYVGTGEENFSGDSYYGAGVLKSTDGGQTWTQSASAFNGGPCGGEWIGAVAVHPANGQVVLAGVQGCYYGSPSIYRSTDGGQTWTAVLTPSSSNWIPVTAIVFDPTNGNLVYAATYNSGLYKSTDAGVTWNPANGTGANVLPTSNLGRAALAIAPSSTSTLYTAIANSSDSDLLGMFKSVDGGNNWTPLPNAPDFCATQCWYDIVLAVSPTNPNFVAAGGVYPYHPGGSAVTTSADGGTTWVDQSSGLHPDTHALAFTPDGTTLYTGNDGGVWSTSNPTASQINWTDLNNSLAITEFYPGISMDPSNVNHTYIGTQDNASEKYTGSLNWEAVNCGDGGATAIDYVTTTNIYVNCIELSLMSSPDDGNTWYDATSGLQGSDRTAWVPPLAMDPVHPTTLYFGTYRAYQTTNGAQLWNLISGDLTNGSGNGTLNTIAVAPTDPNTIYAGSNDGQVNVTRNALAAPASVQWTNVTSSTTLPNRNVTWIAVDPTIATTAYVGFSGFTGFGDSLGHIFQTTNAGSTWTDISSDLPNTPVDAILVDPDSPSTLYIGTDIGVFYSTTGGASWATLGTGLPNVVVTGLGLHEASRTLRASTHGRSVWDLNVSSLLPAPTIGSVSPTTATADGPAFTLTVNGSQYNSSTEAIWNTTPLSTTFVNSGEVTATVPATDLLNGGTATISVMNGAGGVLSNSATFTIDNPAPALTSLSQNSAVAGGAAFTLTVTGSNFVSSSQIEWNGTALATTYGSQTSLSATIPSTDIAAAGSASVSVSNPAPGGGLSGTLSFTINSSTGPTLSPSSVSFGSQTVGATTTIPVTLTNNGSGNLVVTAISNSGTNPGDFSHTSNCGGVTIAPSGFCTIQVKFTPASAGSFSASMNVYDNGQGSPQSIAVSGTGTLGPAVTLSATIVGFPATQVGATSTIPVVLTNTGSGSLSVSSITNGGTNPGDFSHTSNCGGVMIAPGATCTIQVKFTPAALGSFSASLNIADNASNSPQSIAMSGTGANLPAVALSPTSVGFTATQVGAATTVPVTLTNTGKANLAVSSISNGGSNPTEFSHTSNCGGVQIAPNGTCTIQVKFTPLATGSFTAALNIYDNATNSPQSIAMSGTGANPPAVTLSPTSLSFPATPPGVTTTLPVKLTNTGLGNLSVTAIGNSGTNPTDFSHTSNCGGVTIAPNGFCTVQVSFTPASSGSFAATLDITDNAPGSPQTVPLTGSGGNPPAVTLSATSLAFPATGVGASAILPVTVTNTGLGNLSVTAIGNSGTNPADFSHTSNCGGVTIAPGGTCTIQVKFTPAATGGFSAALNIYDNASGSPQSVTLSGTGQ